MEESTTPSNRGDGTVLWACHEKYPEADSRSGTTLRYSLSQKHLSTYLHNRETKLDKLFHIFSISTTITAIFINH
jgi:hypothetical protein